MIVLADVRPHPVLIGPHRVEAIRRRPDVLPSRPALVEQPPIDPHGAHALQEPNRIGNALPGRDAQAQVAMIRNRAASSTSTPRCRHNPRRIKPIQVLASR